MNQEHPGGTNSPLPLNVYQVLLEQLISPSLRAAKDPMSVTFFPKNRTFLEAVLCIHKTAWARTHTFLSLR